MVSTTQRWKTDRIMALRIERHALATIYDELLQKHNMIGGKHVFKLLGAAC